MHTFAIAARLHMVAITSHLVENANCWIWHASVLLAVALEETLLQQCNYCVMEITLLSMEIYCEGHDEKQHTNQ